jgi:hypothetical protein
MAWRSASLSASIAYAWPGALSIAEHEFAGQQLELFVLLDDAEGDQSVVLGAAPAAGANLDDLAHGRRSATAMRAVGAADGVTCSAGVRL